MTEYMILSLHLFYIFSIAAFLLSLAAWGSSHLFFQWVQKFHPESKIFLLRYFGSMPIIGAIIIGLMVSIPALNHNSLLPLEHCHSSTGCVEEATTHLVTFSELSVISLMLLVFINALFKAIKQWYRANKLLNSIELVSHKKTNLDIQLIETETPLAFSVGMLKPKSVISSGLISQLNPQQLHIVCRHEAIHTRYKDSLFKWSLSLVSLFHWPNVKQKILKEHAAALELRADYEVASLVQSNIAVAETIIKVQRIMGGTSNEESLCQFLGTELEQRIHFLLSAGPRYRHLTRKTVVQFILTLMTCALLSAVPLHNAVERILI